MKKVLLIVAVVGLSSPMLRADLKGLAEKAKKFIGEAQKKDLGTLIKEGKELIGQVAPLLQKAKVYPDTTNTNVEILNKAGDIYVVIKSNGKEHADSAGNTLFKIAPKQSMPFDVNKDDFKKDTEILIWEDEKPEDLTSPDYHYKVKAGPVIYVTFKGGKLRPQIGPREGKLKKTDTGLSLENNVRSAAIKKA